MHQLFFGILLITTLNINVAMAAKNIHLRCAKELTAVDSTLAVNPAIAFLQDYTFKNAVGSAAHYYKTIFQLANALPINHNTYEYNQLMEVLNQIQSINLAPGATPIHHDLIKSLTEERTQKKQFLTLEDIHSFLAKNPQLVSQSQRELSYLQYNRKSNLDEESQREHIAEAAYYLTLQGGVPVDEFFGVSPKTIPRRFSTSKLQKIEDSPSLFLINPRNEQDFNAGQSISVAIQNLGRQVEVINTLQGYLTGKNTHAPVAIIISLANALISLDDQSQKEVENIVAHAFTKSGLYSVVSRKISLDFLAKQVIELVKLKERESRFVTMDDAKDISRKFPGTLPQYDYIAIINDIDKNGSDPYFSRIALTMINSIQTSDPNQYYETESLANITGNLTTKPVGSTPQAQNVTSTPPTVQQIAPLQSPSTITSASTSPKATDDLIKKARSNERQQRNSILVKNGGPEKWMDIILERLDYNIDTNLTAKSLTSGRLKDIFTEETLNYILKVLLDRYNQSSIKPSPKTFSQLAEKHMIPKLRSFREIGLGTQATSDDFQNLREIANVYSTF